MRNVLKCKVPHQPMTSTKPSKTSRTNQAEADIDRAVERVYKMYGPDLSVFFGVVKDQLQLDRHEKHDRSARAAH